METNERDGVMGGQGRSCDSVARDATALAVTALLGLVALILLGIA